MLGEEAEGWNGKHERSEGLHKRTRGRLRETPCAAPGQRPQRGLVSVCACAAPDLLGGIAGRNVPQRFSLVCLGFSSLFRGVQRGYFSFQRERGETMKAHDLLVSPETSVAEADCIAVAGLSLRSRSDHNY